MSTRKERKRQQAEERRRQLMSEQLEREIALGALNTRRYRTAWRRMMMRIKMPTIKRNIEVAWHTFERAIDVKDYRISFLMDTRDMAEDQYRRNEMHHMEAIDNLLNLYEARMRKESSTYEESVETVLREAADEAGRINSGETKSQLAQEGILRGVNQRIEESLNDAKSAAISKIDAFVEDSKNARRLAAGQLQKQLENLWDELRAIFSEYQEKTRERRKAYENLATKDARERQIITEQSTQTTALYESIRKLREKIAANKKESEREINEMNEENDFFHNAYWTIKNRFLSEQKIDRHQLTTSTIEYNRILRHLENLLIKAEHLLTLTQACRKYQTQDEKIISFVAPINVQFDDPQLNAMKSSATQSYWEDGLMHKIEAENQYVQMQNFWRRLGSAQIITTELRLERNELKAQAGHLQNCLKRCFSARANTTCEGKNNGQTWKASTE